MCRICHGVAAPKKMLKKYLKIAALATAFLLAVTGCGAKSDNSVSAVSVDENGVENIRDMKDLEDGMFYIYHNGVYKPVYQNEASFDPSKGGGMDESRTLWFNDDWNKVPTMYKGDKLVYYTSEELDETFSLERFAYMGYTIGICNLQRTETGRYSFEIDEKLSNLNMNSDAAKIRDIGKTTVIIDEIGGAKLRSGNVNYGGTVLGLKKGKTYNVQVYVGSELQTTQIKADSIALSSFEYSTLTDYSFLQSRILQINIPQYYNAGYYDINGTGLFRYVPAKSYTSDMDFNAANVIPEESTEDDNEKTEELTIDDAGEGDMQTETLQVPKDGTYTVTVEYTGDPGSVPKAKLVGDKCVYTLSQEKDNVLSGTFDLDAGAYVLRLTDIGEYSYDISQAKKQEK